FRSADLLEPGLGLRELGPKLSDLAGVWRHRIGRSNWVPRVTAGMVAATTRSSGRTSGCPGVRGYTPAPSMELERLQQSWNAFGEQDPLWAILTIPDRRGGRWDVDEFLATGREEVDEVLQELADR